MTCKMPNTKKITIIDMIQEEKKAIFKTFSYNHRRQRKKTKNKNKHRTRAMIENTNTVDITLSTIISNVNE